MLDRRLKAVIFDLWGTLVYPFSRKQNEQLLTKITAVLSVDRDGFARMWTYWIRSFKRVTGVFATIGDNVEHICRSLGVRVDDAVAEGGCPDSSRAHPADARTEDRMRSRR